MHCIKMGAKNRNSIKIIKDVMIIYIIKMIYTNNNIVLTAIFTSMR